MVASIGKDAQGKPVLELAKDERLPQSETIAPLREAVLDLLHHAG
jgi:hypothetical protein